MTIGDWTWFRYVHAQNTLTLKTCYPVILCHKPEHHVICPERLRSMALGRTTNGVKFADL